MTSSKKLIWRKLHLQLDEKARGLGMREYCKENVEFPTINWVKASPVNQKSFQAKIATPRLYWLYTIARGLSAR